MSGVELAPQGVGLLSLCSCECGSQPVYTQARTVIRCQAPPRLWGGLSGVETCVPGSHSAALCGPGSPLHPGEVTAQGRWGTVVCYLGLLQARPVPCTLEDMGKGRGVRWERCLSRTFLARPTCEAASPCLCVLITVCTLGWLLYLFLSPRCPSLACLLVCAPLLLPLVLPFGPCATSLHPSTSLSPPLPLYLSLCLSFSCLVSDCRRPLSCVRPALHMGSSWVAVGPALCLAALCWAREQTSSLRAFRRAPGHCSNWAVPPRKAIGGTALPAMGGPALGAASEPESTWFS